MAADPFRFVERWSTSLGDLMRRAFPGADPPAMAMLLQRLEERDMALEAYLARWLAPISQVAARGASTLNISSSSFVTTVSVDLPKPQAAGVWLVTGYLYGVVIAGSPLRYYTALQSDDTAAFQTTLDSNVVDSVDVHTWSAQGQIQVTEQEIRSGVVPTNAYLQLRVDGATPGTVRAYIDESYQPNRVAATFIPNPES